MESKGPFHGLPRSAMVCHGLIERTTETLRSAESVP